MRTVVIEIMERMKRPQCKCRNTIFLNNYAHHLIFQKLDGGGALNAVEITKQPKLCKLQGWVEV
jgi:hypothetical protein